MNDEQFEDLMGRWTGPLAAQLRARDTAQREALTRVEGERDRLGNEVNQLSKRLCICHECGGRGEVHTGEYTNEGQWQPPEPVMVECGECGGDGQIGQVTDLDAAQAQLAEAVGLLADVVATRELEREAMALHDKIEDFLAQAEQQEAPKRGRPDWSSHGYDQIFQTSDGNWFGARAGWDFKGHISDQWKGREVSLLRDDGGFLAYGEPNPDWESSLEQRPAQESQGAQAGEFQREDRYIVIKRKDLYAAPFEARERFSIALCQLAKLLPKREYLVIESDWPEYEPTWAAIQARVEGRATQPAAAHGDDDGVEVIATLSVKDYFPNTGLSQPHLDFTWAISPDREREILRNMKGPIKLVAMRAQGDGEVQ